MSDWEVTTLAYNHPKLISYYVSNKKLHYPLNSLVLGDVRVNLELPLGYFYSNFI